MLHWNFSRKRVITLVVLLVTFCVWAGPDIVIYGVEGRTQHRRYHPALGFAGAAVAATIVDLWVGKLCRSNWRVALIAAGIVVMILCVRVVYREKGARDNALLENQKQDSLCLLTSDSRSC